MPTKRTSVSVPIEIQVIIRRAAAACTVAGDYQTQSSWLARAVREQAEREKNSAPKAKES